MRTLFDLGHCVGILERNETRGASLEIISPVDRAYEGTGPNMNESVVIYSRDSVLRLRDALIAAYPPGCYPVAK
jgi:hypothetical protein